MTNEDASRAAAELQLDGTYIATDGSLPPANGQGYVLTVGAFFEVRDGRIAHVSNHYNMQDWLRQVAPAPCGLPAAPQLLDEAPPPPAPRPAPRVHLARPPPVRP